MVSKKILFVALILLSLPMGQAKITEIETHCGLFECYTLLELDFEMPSDYVSKEYYVDLKSKVADAIPVSFHTTELSKGIRGMKIEVINKRYLRISGNIVGSTNNYWGLEAFGDTSFWGSTWWNSSFLKRESFNVTNDLSMDRVNLTVVYNQSKDNTTTDCSDIRISNSTDNGEFTRWNITNTVDYCTIRLYDNFTSSETRYYYIYYGNSTPVSKPAYLNSNKYETIWRWNEVDATEFSELDDESTRNLTKTIDDGSPSLAVYQQGTSGGTTLWNITAINPNVNLNDIFYFSYRNMWNGSQPANGLVSTLHRMSDMNNFYDFFTYTQNAGGSCAYGLYLRNRTSGSYNTPLACYATVPGKGLWYDITAYVNPTTNFLYSGMRNSTALYEASVTIGSVLSGNSVGLRYYAGNPQGVGVVQLIKNFEIGTLLTNRNITINAGDEEQQPTTTTTSTTTTSSTTTSTTPLLYVDLSNPIADSSFGQYTTWTLNGTVNCSDAGGCGFATIWAKYDSSFMGSGESLVASNPYPCVDCTPESPCFPTWTVNGTATGDFDIYIYANTSLIENSSSLVNISIYSTGTTTTTTTSTTTTTPATTSTSTIPTYGTSACFNNTFTGNGNRTFYVTMPKDSFVTSSSFNVSGFGYESNIRPISDFNCSESPTEEDYDNTFWFGDLEDNTVLKEEWILLNLSGEVKSIDRHEFDGAEIQEHFYEFNYSIWICPTVLTNFTDENYIDSNCSAPYQLVKSTYFVSQLGENITFDTPYFAGSPSSSHIIKFNTSNSSIANGYGDYIYFDKYDCNDVFRTLAYSDVGAHVVYQDTLPSFSYISDLYPTSFFIDALSDGDSDYSNATLYGKGLDITNLTSEINTYLSTCTPDANGNCTVPFIVHSDTPGIVEICPLSISSSTPILTACGDGNDTSLVMYLKDEKNFTNINGTIKANFDVLDQNGDVDANYNFSFVDVYNASICIYPPWANATVNSFIEYYSTDYPTRDYFHRSATFTNTTANLDLHLLETSEATSISIKTVDESGNPVPNIYVSVQRYYPDLNAFKTVAMGKTDFVGTTLIYLEQYESWYKFIFYDADGNVLKASGTTQISSTTLEITITSTDFGTYWSVYDKISYSCSLSNTTFNLSCSFVDTSGLSNQICLSASELGFLNSTLDLCNTCLTTSSGTLICHLGNTTGKTFSYTLYGVFDGVKHIIYNGLIEDVTTSQFGLEGLFLGGLLFLVMSFVGIWSPTASLFLGGAGLIAGIQLGWIEVSLSAVLGLGVVMVILFRKYMV